jgi:hypothetical protein
MTMPRRTLEDRQAELTRKQISLSLLKASSHLGVANVSDAAKNDAAAIAVLKKAIADIEAIPRAEAAKPAQAKP